MAITIFPLPSARVAVAAATVLLVVGAAWAADQDSCDLPERVAAPAAGSWKGSYRLTFDLVRAPITIRMKWEGDLAFDLDRYEPPKTPPAAPPANPLRTPLGAKVSSSRSTTGPTTSVSPEEFAKAMDRLNGILP